MRLIDIINSVPHGHWWSGYVRLFFKTLSVMVVMFLSFVITIVFLSKPYMLAEQNENILYMLWYFLTVPCSLVVWKFSIQQLGWDDIYGLLI